MTYHELVAAKLCIDCRSPTEKHIRCDDCHRLHLQDSRERKPARGIYRCGTCRERGHNATTCPANQSPSAAPAA